MNTVRALERLVWGPRSVPELADELQLSAPNARRLLRRLAVEGYARQGGWHERRRYGLTLKLAALGRQLIEEHDLPVMASPTLTDLAITEGAPVALWIPGLRAAICVLSDDGHPEDDLRGLQPRPFLGALADLDRHAAGQVLQAWRAPGSRGAAAIRARGHALVRDGEGVTVAAPIFDAGEVIAALSLVTTAEPDDGLLQRVVAAAALITEVLLDGIR